MMHQVYLSKGRICRISVQFRNCSYFVSTPNQELINIPKYVDVYCSKYMYILLALQSSLSRQKCWRIWCKIRRLRFSLIWTKNHTKNRDFFILKRAGLQLINQYYDTTEAIQVVTEKISYYFPPITLQKESLVTNWKLAKVCGTGVIQITHSVSVR